uniref:P-type domain-containing protein n=2 Tax=Ciona intestinalis TaxID=7719 RepID=H2XRC2_CIOIN
MTRIQIPLVVLFVLLLQQECFSKFVWKMSSDLSKEWTHGRLKAFESGEFEEEIEESEVREVEEEGEEEKEMFNVPCAAECSTAYGRRVSCEYTGKSEKKCLSRNCCWDDTASDVRQRCFKKDSSLCSQPTCETTPPNYRIECQALLDNPWMLTNENECLDAGCCWDPFVSQNLPCYDKFIERASEAKCQQVPSS